MSAITQNLPPFVKDLGITIIGKKCYVSLVENLNIGDVECLRYAVSKGLGLGIVVGGSVMKVPQMLLILNAGSAEGLSLTAYILETLSYAITLSYSVKNNFPFSTYGENLFLTLQDIIITLLIINYNNTSSSSSNKPGKLITALLATFGTAYTLNNLPLNTLSLVQAATLPLSLFSKVPQIIQNQKAGSTGQLSAIAIIAQVLGCLARLFTTATEVKDSIVAAGFGLALLLNLVLGAQLWMFWGKSTTATVVPEKKEKVRAAPFIDAAPAPVATPVTPVRAVQEEKEVETKPTGKTSAYEELSNSPQPTHRFATPPPRSFSPATGQRKWARKTAD